MLFAVFVLAAATSLGASIVLVSRLERVGERLGASAALLGLVTALAADAPEITAAAAAIAGGHAAVGLGVTLGSNVFNLAALLGVGALVAGRVRLHRRVVELEGSLALVVAVVALAVVVGVVGPPLGLLIILAPFVPYVGVSILRPAARERLAIPASARRWLCDALNEEEAELAIRPEPGGATDALVALGATALVMMASLVMEEAAVSLGASAGMPEIVVGGLLLAAVTSLPNAVAGVQLASHGRGPASLSTALNSNGLNVLVGFLVPAAIAGLRAFSPDEELVVVTYLILTILALALAWTERGLNRRSGSLIVAGYLLFAGIVATR